MVHPAPSAPPGNQAAGLISNGAARPIPGTSQHMYLGFPLQQEGFQPAPNPNVFGQQHQQVYEEKQPGGPPVMQPIQPMTSQLTSTQPITQPLMMQQMSQPTMMYPISSQPMQPQQMMSQLMTSQQMTSQPMTSQQVMPQSMTMQPAMPHPTATQQMTSHPMMSHPMMTQPPMTSQQQPMLGMQPFNPAAPNANVPDNAPDTIALDTGKPLLTDTMQKMTGYQNVGYDDTSFVPPPPSYEEATRQPDRNFDNCVPEFDETELRAALEMYVAEQSCYGITAARRLKFTELKHKCAYHYKLESYGETRSTSWANMPFQGQGQQVDGPENGVAPQPWQVAIPTPELFVDYMYLVMVPHTSFVHKCYRCSGSGKIRCTRCNGRGKISCSSCHGSGKTGSGKDRKKCMWCSGGRKRCPKCSGSCKITCVLCKGNKKLMWYIQIKSLWKNHVTDHVILHTDLPNHLVLNVPGETVFAEQQPRVVHLSKFPQEEVNETSKSLVDKHNSDLTSQRLHMQRHSIRVIPVTQALYSWKGENSDFFVYGLQKKVYAPNYPQQCYWGCAII